MSKSPKSLTPPARLTQAMLGTAGVILVAGGGLVALLNGQISGLRHTVETKEAEVGSSEQVTRRYQSTLDTYSETRKRLEFLEASVSQKSYVPTLLQQLQSLADTTHVTLTAVHPSAAPAPVASATSSVGGSSDSAKKTPPPYDTLDISVDATGTYGETVAFLYGLTRFPKIVSVSGATIHPGGGDTPGAGKSAATVVTTNLHLTAFVFHDDGPAPTAPPVSTTLTAHGTDTTIAGHAALAAQGADRAAKDRSQVGLSTL